MILTLIVARQAMALHTAAVLFGMFLACLVADPEVGWAGIPASTLASGRATRLQLLLATLLPFCIDLLVLQAIRVSEIGVGLGMAVLVSVTMVPLVLRILRDGYILDELEMQRAAAAALNALNDTLDERVKQRTASLSTAEAQLRQSQKMEAVG